ncbi:hypothetical protein B9Z65_5011 [Elsinoe australis]|uniref:F-box domain-containing protein n=1 Tax=Elsinoe australis TaxID=40998 RepID=A0A2P7ZCU5_9PEZI|nr:hypothetical protein B9Z65_5011 [Elsinoe australis]
MEENIIPNDAADRRTDLTDSTIYEFENESIAGLGELPDSFYGLEDRYSDHEETDSEDLILDDDDKTPNFDDWTLGRPNDEPFELPKEGRLTEEQVLDLLSWEPFRIRSYPDIIKNILSDAPCISAVEESDESSSLGDLDRLPFEIVELVVQHMDGSTLFAFRKVNRRAFSLVDYQTCVLNLCEEVSTIMAAVFDTGMKGKYTAAEACELLENDRCSSCHQSFGPWVFLPTMKRACYRCIHTKKDFRLVKPKTAQKMFDLTDEDLDKICYFTTMCNRWRRDTWSDYNREKSHTLISFALARDYALQKHNITLEAFRERLQSTKPHRDISKRQQLIALTYLDGTDTEAHDGTLMDPYSLLDDFRGLGCLAVPKWTKDRGIENALYCFGCFLDHHTSGSAGFACDAEDLCDDWYIARNREEFLEHVQRCPVAREIRQRIESGKVRPKPGRYRFRGRKDRPGEHAVDRPRDNLIGELPGVDTRHEMDDDASSDSDPEMQMYINHASMLRQRWESDQMSDAEARMWERQGINFRLTAEEEFMRRMGGEGDDMEYQDEDDLEDGAVEVD